MSEWIRKATEALHDGHGTPADHHKAIQALIFAADEQEARVKALEAINKQIADDTREVMLDAIDKFKNRPAPEQRGGCGYCGGPESDGIHHSHVHAPAGICNAKEHEVCAANCHAFVPPPETAKEVSIYDKCVRCGEPQTSVIHEQPEQERSGKPLSFTNAHGFMPPASSGALGTAKEGSVYKIVEPASSGATEGKPPCNGEPEAHMKKCQPPPASSGATVKGAEFTEVWSIPSSGATEGICTRCGGGPGGHYEGCIPPPERSPGATEGKCQSCGCAPKHPVHVPPFERTWTTGKDTDHFAHAFIPPPASAEPRRCIEHNRANCGWKDCEKVGRLWLCKECHQLYADKVMHDSPKDRAALGNECPAKDAWVGLLLEADVIAGYVRNEEAIDGYNKNYERGYEVGRRNGIAHERQAAQAVRDVKEASIIAAAEEQHKKAQAEIAGLKRIIAGEALLPQPEKRGKG